MTLTKVLSSIKTFRTKIISNWSDDKLNSELQFSYISELLDDLKLSTLDPISVTSHHCKINLHNKTINTKKTVWKQFQLKKILVNFGYIIKWQIYAKVTKSCAWSLLKHKFSHQRNLESTSINFALARQHILWRKLIKFLRKYVPEKQAVKLFFSFTFRNVEARKMPNSYVLCCNIIAHIISSWLRTDFWGSRGSSEQQPWTWMLSKHENISFRDNVEEHAQTLQLQSEGLRSCRGETMNNETKITLLDFWLRSRYSDLQFK